MLAGFIFIRFVYKVYMYKVYMVYRVYRVHIRMLYSYKVYGL